MAAATISIELEPEAAKAYARSPEQQQHRLQLLSNLWLRAPEISHAELRATMDRLAAKAEANGLTPEILAEILADNRAD